MTLEAETEHILKFENSFLFKVQTGLYSFIYFLVPINYYNYNTITNTEKHYNIIKRHVREQTIVGDFIIKKQMLLDHKKKKNFKKR